MAEIRPAGARRRAVEGQSPLSRAAERQTSGEGSVAFLARRVVRNLETAPEGEFSDLELLESIFTELSDQELRRVASSLTADEVTSLERLGFRFRRPRDIEQE